MLSCQNHPIFQTPQYQRRTTNLPLSKASLKGPLSSSHLNIWSFLPQVYLQLKHRNSSMKTTLEGAKGLTNSLCGVSSKAFELSKIYTAYTIIYVYIYILYNHQIFTHSTTCQAPDRWSPVVLQQCRPHRLPGIWNLRAFSEGVPSWRITRKVGDFLSKLNHPKWKILVWMGFSEFLVNDLQVKAKVSCTVVLSQVAAWKIFEIPLWKMLESENFQCYARLQGGVNPFCYSLCLNYH